MCCINCKDIFHANCRDGASQCGVYVASHWLLEQASTEKEVNVFDTVRQIRSTRPQFITDMVRGVIWGKFF